MEKLALHGGTPAYTHSHPIWPIGTPDDLQALKEADWFSRGGASCQKLSEDLKALCETKYAFPVANGTVSLELILRAMGIGYGDEVILPPYTFIATLSSIVYANATPVFADIDPETYMLSPKDAESKITPKTKAIVAVAVSGQPCDFEALEDICRRHQIALIVDAAQAVGARYKGRSIGAIGNVASFSCQNTKNLTAGEAGFITTSDDALAENLMALLGLTEKEGFTDQGHLLTDVQAALLDRQLQPLPEQIALRMKNAAYLDEALKDDLFVSPVKKDDGIDVHAYHLYLFRVNYKKLAEYGLTREDYLKALQAEGLNAGPGYMPLYTFASICGKAATDRIERPIDLSPLPACEIASRLEGGWFEQFVLLETPEGIRGVAEAFRKVGRHIEELKA